MAIDGPRLGALVTATRRRARQVNRRVLIVLSALLALVTVVAIGDSRYRQAAMQASDAQWAASVLDPIAVLLEQNRQILGDLQMEPSVESDKGVLEAYLTKIRTNGVPKNAATKQRLDRLADNNAAIVALIKVYAPHARTAAYKTASDDFRNYASAWRDRWNSVMELFMSGGDYAAAGVPFPADIVAAVAAEAGATSPNPRAIGVR